MYFIPQVKEGDCGIACLKMILATLNKDKNYAYLPFKESSKSFSFKELIKLGADNGLTLEGIQVLNKDELANCSDFPFIASLKRETTNHAVVVTKVFGKTVKVYDPEFGATNIPLNEFIDEWSGEALMIRNHEARKCTYKEENIVSTKKMIPAYLLQLASGILAILGVYFIKPEGDLVFPVIFLAGSLIMSIFMKSYLLFIMKSSDQFIVEKSKEIKVKNLFSFYQSFESFKGGSFSSSMNLIYYILVSAFLIFVVVFNGLSNYLLIMMPIILLFISCFFISPYFKKEQNKINVLEASLSKVKDVDEFDMKVNNLHALSYRYSKMEIAKRNLFIFLYILTALLTAYLTKEISITNIVFNVCIEILIYQNLEPIILVEEKNLNSFRNKIHLNNIIHQNDEIK